MPVVSGCGVRGVVLAGVHQWEQNVFEQVLPRTLLPVANSPLISYPLRWLRRGGIDRMTICANSSSHLIQGYLSDEEVLGITPDYYEDIAPRGPAGCLRDA